MTDETNVPKIVEDDGDDEVKNFGPKIFEGVVTHKAHHIYFSEAIGDPVDYVDVIHRIKMAAAGDVIYMYLNLPGGRIDTGVQILNAMRASQAHIITVMEGEVCSLGTIIFLSGDEFVVHDHCLFMIHNFSGGVSGKGHEQMAQLEGITRWFTSICREVYLPFLTEKELDSVLKGDDLWFSSEDVRKRLNKMIKILKKEEAARLKAEKTK